jgi:gag-polypeptide of LTR copia-type/GAG-pre-integrase domain
MATSPINSTASATTNPPLLEQIVHINVSFPSKLTDTNFLSWKNQIQLIIEGHDLDSFLYNSPPDPTMYNTAGETILNPQFLIWKRQDKLLNAWIRSSLSDGILAQVMTSPTCKDLWHAIETYFSINSRARLQELKGQLQSVSKGDSNCSDYLLRIRKLADELSFIGNPIPEDDLVQAALKGLGADFSSLKTSILTARCHTNFTFSDLRGLLLSHESLNSAVADSNPTAFLAGKLNKNKYQSQSKINYNFSNNPNNSIKPNSNSPFSSNSFNNQKFPNHESILAMIASGQLKIPCQICQRMGHLTKKCYKRYNKDPEWRPPPKFNAYNTFTVDSTSQDPDSSTWIVDSGSSHNVTNDVQNLNSFFSYKGTDKLHIGNGVGLEISHIGSQILQVGDYTIKLNNVLCVPKFSTNLISLSQLLLDNPSLLINFTSSSCFIKDHHLPKIPPLHITSSHGLYKFKVLPINHTLPISQVFHTSSSSSTISSRASTSTWHARLGHPSTPTTLKIINSNSLPCTRNKFTFCKHCIQAKAHILPFNPSSSTSSSPLELIHSDLWGPSPIVSYKGYKYYVIFVDDFSRFTWIYFLKNKSDVVQAFTIFKAQVENLLNTTIKILRTDGGGGQNISPLQLNFLILFIKQAAHIHHSRMVLLKGNIATLSSYHLPFYLTPPFLLGIGMRYLVAQCIS